MDNNENIKFITTETKNAIEGMSAVTPSMYSSIFSKLARKHSIDINSVEEIAQSILAQEYISLTELQDKTFKNTVALSSSTSRAIGAIKEKDEKKLSIVLKEAEALRIKVEELKGAIYKDELTNVYNRKWLNDNLLVSESKAFKDAGVLAIIDLNYFKLVNDNLGHIVGDKVLIFIADSLKKTKYEVVRYGGDEFIIIFPKEVSNKKALKLLEDLRENIISKKLKSGDKSFTISFSIGTVSFDKGEKLTDIVAKADKKMYLDKKEIKKRITGI